MGKHICSRCGEPRGEGEILDEQFLCNSCLHVLMVDSQNEHLLDDESDPILYGETSPDGYKL